MEITGKIIVVQEPRSGVSQRTGNKWMSQEYVIETHDQFAKRCCFRVFGEERIKNFNIQANEEMTVSFDVDAHEYQGRWFNEINCWAVNRNAPGAAAPAAGAPAAAAPAAAAPFPPAQPAAAQGENDGLPF